MSGVSQHITLDSGHTNLAVSTHSTSRHLSILQVLGLLVDFRAYAVVRLQNLAAAGKSRAKVVVVPGGKWPLEYL